MSDLSHPKPTTSASLITVEATVLREIEASPEDVWRILTDLDNAKGMLPGVIEIERLEGPAYDVGTRWKETRRVFGVAASEVMEVTHVDPCRSTTVQAENRGVIYTTEFHLIPGDRFTVLSMSLLGEMRSTSRVSRALMALSKPLTLAATKRAIARDLDAIAHVAEHAHQAGSALHELGFADDANEENK